MDDKSPGLETIQPLVSVIMSVYNGEKFLQDAIHSVIKQTHFNWEFIIINDASKDGTENILSSYSHDKRFKIARQVIRNGLTRNLNIAIEMCNGAYIARMDADDINLPGRFAEQVQYLQQHHQTVAVCSLVEFIDEKGNPAGTWADDQNAVTFKKIKQILPFRNCLAHPTVMIRKEILQKYKYNEKQTHSQDWDLWLRLVAEENIIEKINKTLLLYRIHSNSMTKISNKRSAFLKMHHMYTAYLESAWENKKINFFNFKVLVAYILNMIKLFVSKAKRSFNK